MQVIRRLSSKCCRVYRPHFAVCWSIYTCIRIQEPVASPQCDIVNISTVQCDGPCSHSAVCDISPVSSPASSRPGQWQPSADSPQLSGAQWSSVELTRSSAEVTSLIEEVCSYSLALLSAPPPTPNRYI